MRFIWITCLLLSLCACDSPANPLPSESDINSSTPVGKIVPLAQIFTAPPDAAVCLLTPYADVVNSGKQDPSLPEAAAMNDFLKRDPKLTDDGTWGLIISGPDGIKMRTYTRRSFEVGDVAPASSPQIGTFQRKDCSRMARAAFLKIDAGGKNVLYFGSLAP